MNKGDIMNDQSEISKNSHVRTSVSPNKSEKFVMLDDQEIIICPLDETHRIQFSEFQCHLERCLIGDLMTKTCPKNPLHIVDEASYDHHVEHCQDTPTEQISHDQSPDS